MVYKVLKTRGFRERDDVPSDGDLVSVHIRRDVVDSADTRQRSGHDGCVAHISNKYFAGATGFSDGNLFRAENQGAHGFGSLTESTNDSLSGFSRSACDEDHAGDLDLLPFLECYETSPHRFGFDRLLHVAPDVVSSAFGVADLQPQILGVDDAFWEKI